jgi:hypothetical protein
VYLLLNNNFPTVASSVLKTVANTELVTEAELHDTIDKPLKEIIHDEKTQTNSEQGERS